jgi:hypothetical protein
MRAGRVVFEVIVDFIDHEVRIETSSGQVEKIPLASRPVAEFYREFMSRLRGLKIDVEISTKPSEVKDPIPFPMDTVHATYDPAWANHFWSALTQVAFVMGEHRARFGGKTSAIHFFWGSFDLAHTRYSGRPADPGPNADLIMRLAHDAEQICAGFWPGDQQFPQPAFYAYTYPKPDGIETAVVQPSAATWNAEIGEFILPYEAARLAGDPRQALLSFLESTYEAGASKLGWSPDLVRVP